ncbi:protein prenylyltransferase [Microthyrium microscopicum]|uniref:Geranylgeranyl transferase type-2 subunit alpha n=1 Tax=Microthyrium microscopicum TaxID=703497 RepID=A0A6A6UBR7_9PEZI|nr:protein prenylyltransferase [Microthyrium microscopicum]
MRAPEFSSNTLNAISKLLAKNPEYYTIWNYRRRVLQALFNREGAPPANLIASDLQFLVPLMVQYPKCYWIWNYRMWLLDQVKTHLELDQAVQFWKEEVGLVGKMLTRDERNFHGWDYRRHVILQLEELQQVSMVESEFEYTTKMIRKALQNFSALHYRSKLIPRLLSERNASNTDRRKLFDQELDMMQEALIDPFNQSAWFYHQYLMSTLDCAYPAADLIITDLLDSDRQRYLEQEIERIKEILEDYDDCKWIYQSLLQYHADFAAYVSTPKDEVGQWLSELQRLDPMRSKRWAHVQTILKL